ncbi:hypothetical protein Q3O60_10110 [Alkalimonas collagenimarina]|uniref:Uncharacterized protein n=1 Tax=Alkalimonas collagenimarina TaxID=400390 RepID=A0ABT9GZQ6_9GAMM|nr:hypothetical protein [Alkalimonas collagenimarina]MDP4536542.1 hypothetical protein [Alkalimonas collagenimarina]
MKLSQKHTKRIILSELSLAHAIKAKMGQDYHGLQPPHFALGMAS